LGVPTYISIVCNGSFGAKATDALHFITLPSFENSETVFETFKLFYSPNFLYNDSAWKTKCCSINDEMKNYE